MLIVFFIIFFVVGYIWYIIDSIENEKNRINNLYLLNKKEQEVFEKIKKSIDNFLKKFNGID